MTSIKGKNLYFDANDNDKNDEEYKYDVYEITEVEEEENIIPTFNIKDKIIYKIDNTKCFIKIKAIEFIYYCNNWIYNRPKNLEKIKELKEKFNKKTSPVWNISLIYDETSNKDFLLYIIDGQHRREVVKELLIEEKIDKDFDIYCTVYNINHCETINSDIATELFKNINNNLPLDLTQIADNFVKNIIEKIINNNELNPGKKGIKTMATKDDIKECVAHEPRIHKGQLIRLFTDNKELFKHLEVDDIIKNLIIIKNKICYEDYNKIYGNTKKYTEKHIFSKNIDFWLGLKSSKKYSPDIWIKYITKPHEFN